MDTVSKDQTPKPPDVPKESLDCSLTDVAALGADAKAKTVGDLMTLKCTGMMTTVITGTPEITFAKPEEKYSLHLLKIVSADAGEFTATVTSYIPGEYQNKEVFLTTPDKTYQLKNLSWTYGSVLEEAQQLQKETVQPPPEEFGPFPFVGPVGISYPIWIWLVIAGCVLLPSVFIGRSLRKHSQKKKLIQAALSGMGSALTPVQDFSKIQRQVIRSLDTSPEGVLKLLENLDSGFRSYLVRRCLVPAFDWSEGEVVRDIRKHHPMAYQAAGSDVLKILREFRKIKDRSCSKEDLEQLLEQSRKAVEKLERSL